MKKTDDNESLPIYLKSVYPTLSIAEKKIADHIVKNITLIPDYSIAELSEKCNVSEASIIRFTKKVGFTGYYQMKIRIAKTLFKEDKKKVQRINPKNTYDLKQIVLDITLKNITDSFNTISDKNLAKALDLIEKSKNVYFFAAGNSIPVAMEAAYKLGKIGIGTFCPLIPELALTHARNMKKGDIAFLITRSGDSRLLTSAINILKQQSIPSICMCNYQKSPVANEADILLMTAAHYNILDNNFDTSKSAEHTIIDLLFYNLAFRRKNELSDIFIRTETDTSQYKL